VLGTFGDAAVDAEEVGTFEGFESEAEMMVSMESISETGTY
jgi:hypothetical protein